MSKSFINGRTELLNRSFSKALIYFGDGRMNEIEACFMLLDTFTDYYVEGQIAQLLPKIPNSIILLIRDQLHEIVHLGIERRVGFAGKAFDPEQTERYFARHNQIHHILYDEITKYIVSTL